MNILAIGDVVGTKAIEYLQANLWKQRNALGVDFVVANGENASDIHGLSAADAQALLDAGVDVITMGNHTYGRRDLYPSREFSPSRPRRGLYPFVGLRLEDPLHQRHGNRADGVPGLPLCHR